LKIAITTYNDANTATRMLPTPKALFITGAWYVGLRLVTV